MLEQLQYKPDILQNREQRSENRNNICWKTM